MSYGGLLQYPGQRQPKLGYGAGIPRGGTTHAGHGIWEMSIGPPNLSLFVGSKRDDQHVAFLLPKRKLREPVRGRPSTDQLLKQFKKGKGTPGEPPRPKPPPGSKEGSTQTEPGQGPSGQDRTFAAQTDPIQTTETQDIADVPPTQPTMEYDQQVPQPIAPVQEAVLENPRIAYENPFASTEDAVSVAADALARIGRQGLETYNRAAAMTSETMSGYKRKLRDSVNNLVLGNRSSRTPGTSKADGRMRALPMPEQPRAIEPAPVSDASMRNPSVSDASMRNPSVSDASMRPPVSDVSMRTPSSTKQLGYRKQPLQIEGRKNSVAPSDSISQQLPNPKVYLPDTFTMGDGAKKVLQITHGENLTRQVGQMAKYNPSSNAIDIDGLAGALRKRIMQSEKDRSSASSKASSKGSNAMDTDSLAATLKKRLTQSEKDRAKSASDVGVKKRRAQSEKDKSAAASSKASKALPPPPAASKASKALPPPPPPAASKASTATKASIPIPKHLTGFKNIDFASATQKRDYERKLANVVAAKRKIKAAPNAPEAAQARKQLPKLNQRLESTVKKIGRNVGGVSKKRK